MFMALRLPARGAASTVISYGLDISSYFRDPMALTDSSSRSASRPRSVCRAGGLVVNTIVNGIVGALGWALGALLPVRDR